MPGSGRRKSIAGGREPLAASARKPLSNRSFGPHDSSIMNRTTTCLLLMISAPVPLAAQGFTLAPFAATNDGLAGAAMLVGVSGTAWSGPVGLRLGGAVDAFSAPMDAAPGAPSHEVQAWTGDIDLVVSGGRGGVRLGGVEPGVFVGFGVHGQRDAFGEAASIPVWSYGVTAGLPVADWLELTTEARYRMPHESDLDALPAGVGGGVELRAGVSLHLGGQRRPRATGRRTTIHLGGGRGGRPTATPASTGRRSASAADRVASTLDTADDYVGVPYQWGGDTPSEGFDCSGYVQYVYALNGVRLPRVSRDQARFGSPLPPRVSAVLPGDLLFFAGANGVVSHVAIYVGDNTILHSSGSRGAVGYDRLDSRRGRWYATHLVGARRVIH